MYCIFEDSKGDIWISTRGGTSEQYGLSRWDRATEKFFTFSVAQGFPSGRSASSFAEDKNGNLWFGFYEGGLVRYANGRFTEFTLADGLPAGLITALHLDRQGRLWIASALSGLSRIDDPSVDHPHFANYTIDNGLASNNARSLAEDLYGNIYVGTARGVDKLSPDTTRIRHYSVKDGLTGDFVNVAFRDRTGALWFGTPNGLSRLMPEPKVETTAPSIWLGGLRIAGESRTLPELGVAEISGLELAHAQNNLQIDFFGIDFNAEQTLRYQYMLEGADRDWSQLTEQRTVNYANLAPGSYRFWVRAVNANGVSSSRPASISLRILLPFWQRWWFVALMSLMLIGIVYALYRYRLAQLLKVERVRTRIATDLHDDIGASLSRMAIMGEILKQQHLLAGTAENKVNAHVDNGNDAHSENTHERSSKMLTEITDSAREIVDSMSDIVWAINPNKDHLSDLIGHMRNLAGEMSELADIGLRVMVNGFLNSLEYRQRFNQ